MSFVPKGYKKRFKVLKTRPNLGLLKTMLRSFSPCQWRTTTLVEPKYSENLSWKLLYLSNLVPIWLISDSPGYISNQRICTQIAVSGNNLTLATSHSLTHWHQVTLSHWHYVILSLSHCHNITRSQCNCQLHWHCAWMPDCVHIRSIKMNPWF